MSIEIILTSIEPVHETYVDSFLQLERVGNTDFHTCLPRIAAKVELFDHNTRKKKEGRTKLCQSILAV